MVRLPGDSLMGPVEPWATGFSLKLFLCIRLKFTKVVSSQHHGERSLLGSEGSIPPFLRGLSVRESRLETMGV